MDDTRINKLFDKAKTTINEHIKNIYEEGELKEEFSTNPTNYYNLELIIAIGYRENLFVKLKEILKILESFSKKNR